MLKLIKKALKAVWNSIKKLVLKIISFFKNIVNWFKDPKRVKKVQEDKDVIAVAIKEKLDNGDYNVVNCFFYYDEGELVDFKTDALSVTAGELDNETKKHFDNKD